ncbi:Putative serine/threonine-protein kinase pknH [Minicystis rosea]|nr:Putative serine/threonine-protein kinase pknH [Minicystis rosea]
MLGILVGLVSASGCGLILGFEDHELWPSTSSSSSLSSSGTSSTGGGTGGTGGVACGSQGFAEPIVFATGESVPHEIAVDANAVYWVDIGTAVGQGQVVRVDKAPPHTRTILEGSLVQALGMAVDAAHVYTTYAAGNGYTVVHQLPKGGGPPNVVYNYSGGNGAFAAFALQGATFAIATAAPFEGGTVCLGDTASKSCTQLASNLGPVRAVALDAGTIYWSTNQTGEVFRRQGSTSEAFVAAGGEAGLSSLTIDADNVYWTNDGDGTVKMLAKSSPGGEPTVLATNEGSPRGIAVDDECVYWADYTSGLVRAAPKAGGPSITLAAGQGPYAIAVDASGVYAAVEGDGVVLQIAKK